MKKTFSKALYLLLAIPAIWFSVHLYNRHELTSCYQTDFKNTYLKMSYYDLKLKDSCRETALNISEESLKKTKMQMYQDGYNRTRIEKIRSKAFDQAMEHIGKLKD